MTTEQSGRGGDVRAILEKAGELERSSKLQEAIQAYEESLKIEERLEILQHLGNLYNQTGQTFPIVLLWMAFFLTGSLVLSSIVNYFNRRLKLVER